MKKDIAVIRESITKVVALLTKRSITVTQRGSKAYVQYHARTGAIQLVNLPYMPDDATDEFIAAVQGFLDHEVGHVLYTDPKIMPTLKKESAKVKNLANAIEDVFIERKMSEAFAGSGGNLNSVRKFYLDKIARPKIEAALAVGDLNTAAGYAGLVQFRAWGGQQLAIDFLRDTPKYAELVKPLAEKLGEELIAGIKKAKNSWECLDLARAMKKKLDEKKPEDAGADSPDDGSSGDAGKGSERPPEPPPESPKDDTPEPDETPEDKDEAEDPGKTTTEADDSDKERDERSETEEEVEPEAGDSEGSEDGEREESTDEDDEGDEDAAPEPDDGSDGDDEGEGAEPESGDGDQPDSDDTGADDDQPDTGLSVDEGSPETPDDADEGEGETEAAAGESDEEGDELPDHDDHSATGSEDETDEEPEEDLSDLFEEGHDFDEDLSRALTEVAAGEIEKSAYQIFSTDWDMIEPAPKATNDASIEAMVEKTQHMVSGIQKGLERAIAAKARKTWNPGQRRGRIAPGALFKTAVGDDRVFRQRYETQAKNTAVSLLVDCSGSMSWGDKIGTAGMAAFALSSTLERLKIQHEVIGFTTRHSRSMVSAMKAEGMGIDYARKQALYMPVFKGFGDRLDVEAKSRMAHLTETSCHEWLRENVDGECLQIAARRLKAQRAERHLLIVLSDGSPACPGNWPQLCSHLKESSTKLRSDAGVEVVGVGIQDRNVTKFYDRHVVLTDLADLPTTVVGELAKVLLQP